MESEYLLFPQYFFWSTFVLSTEILRRIHCLAMTSLQKVGYRVPIGSVPPLHHRVPTTQSLTGRRRSTRLSTGKQNTRDTASSTMSSSAFFKTKFNSSILFQFPVFGARWGKVIISSWRHGLWHLPQRRTQTGEACSKICLELEIHWTESCCLIGCWSSCLLRVTSRTDTKSLWIVLLSSGTIAGSASGGTGGEVQSLLRSVTWTSLSSRATSSRFSSIGWVAS